MEHERQMQARQRLEAEARRRLELKGVYDPRRGGACNFDDVKRYDEWMALELRHITVITNPRNTAPAAQVIPSPLFDDF